MNATALALTVALHVVLVATGLARCVEPAAQEPKQEKKSEGEALEVRLLPSADTPAEDAPPCPRSYRGIGIKRSFMGTVFEVLPGGPAHRAGIQADDVLVGDELEVDRFMVGHRITLRFRRGEQDMSAVVVIGRVCYEGDAP